MSQPTSPTLPHPDPAHYRDTVRAPAIRAEALLRAHGHHPVDYEYEEADGQDPTAIYAVFMLPGIGRCRVSE